MHSRIGQQIGNYLLKELIGRGSFSEVYLGHHSLLQSPAAIKIIPPFFDSSSHETFLQEAQALSQLIHPHIVRLLDFALLDDMAYLVMEYAAGASLRQRHPGGTPVDLSTVVSYCQQIATALRYVHNHQLIHRDLKPENLLLGAAGQILLADFGLATLKRHSMQYAPTLAAQGTLAYMAPEQFRGKPTAFSDQYALGICVYEWLTGTLPFHGSLAELCHQHLLVPPPPLRATLPTLPVSVEQVVLTALAKEQDQRFPDVSTFAQALLLASQGEEWRQLHAAAALSHSSPALGTPLSTPPLHLIGRDEERERIAFLLLQPEVRLVTLTGPGGIGKTSLALSLLHDLHEAFADGICFVPLVAIHQSDLVLHALAEALGQQTGNRSIAEMVQTFLRNKHMLLVLDNFEQVIQAAPHLSQVLFTCPGVKLLVTSRERLLIQGEYEMEIPPLKLPPRSFSSSEMPLVLPDAMALFVHAAQTIKPNFRLTEVNGGTIAEICRLLDGLPLALELAAARIKLLPPEALLSRLGNRLPLLTGGRRDAPAHQQTLRDTIKWSYDLLTVDEQRIFRWLCVCVGGCSLPAIEEIAQRLGDDPIVVLDGITSLHNKSLIKSEEQSSSEPRLSLLETIREFGLSCLRESGSLREVQYAHAHYYLDWAEEGGRELFGPKQGLWVVSLLQERGNLWAAMQFLLEERQQEAALQLAGALGRFWLLLGVGNQRSFILEGVQFMGQALKASQGSESAWRARALVLFAGVLAWQERSSESLPPCQEGIALFQRLGDLEGVIMGQCMLWLVWFAQCRLHEAREAIKQAIKLIRQYPEVCTQWGAEWTLGFALFYLIVSCSYDGHYAEGTAALEECTTLCRKAGDGILPIWAMAHASLIAVSEGRTEPARHLAEASVQVFEQLRMFARQADALRYLGLVAWQEGKLDQAEAKLQESLRVAREADDEQATSGTLTTLARLDLARGRLSQASHRLQESLRLSIERLDTLRIPASLEGLGMVAAREGKPTLAVSLLGAAHPLRQTQGLPIPLIEREEYEDLLASLRLQLGKTAFLAAWEQGQTTSPAQALHLFEEESKTPSHDPLPIPKPAKLKAKTTFALTRRELEVLQLLSDGASNKAIAEQLVLSVVTVNSYLRNIYSKLGVSSRTAAVRRALESHLVEWDEK